MEFTDATSGDRATIHPNRLAVASHTGNGVWHIHRLPTLAPWCTIHSGNTEAVPVWHDRLPRLLFYTADSVLLFDLEGRDGNGDNDGGDKRQPNMPDGVIKEARTVRIRVARFLPDDKHIVVQLENGLGVRLWSVVKRHEPVLSTSSPVYTHNDRFIVVVVEKALYVLAVGDFTVVDKWRLPDGAILSNFVLLENRHYSGRYGILAWQSEEQVPNIQCLTD